MALGFRGLGVMYEIGNLFLTGRSSRLAIQLNFCRDQSVPPYRSKQLEQLIKHSKWRDCMQRAVECFAPLGVERS